MIGSDTFCEQKEIYEVDEITFSSCFPYLLKRISMPIIYELS